MTGSRQQLAPSVRRRLACSQVTDDQSESQQRGDMAAGGAVCIYLPGTPASCVRDLMTIYRTKRGSEQEMKEKNTHTHKRAACEKEIINMTTKIQQRAS